MGNHSSHEKLKEKEKEAGNGITSRKGSIRVGTTPRGSNAGSEAEKTEPQPQPQPSLVPVEKLGKLLAQRSQKEDGVSGVTENSFTRYLFPKYPELARQFYRYVHNAGKCKNLHIPVATFRQQCERVLALLDDAAIIETYVRMFGSESGDGTVSPEGLRNLLYTSYKLSMDHYPDGPQTCLRIQHTLSAVVDGCFPRKEPHSAGFVARWLQEHCRRIIFPLHRYCVHMISTRHRDLDSESTDAALSLGTPVLERAVWGRAGRLCPSAAWLVAAGAPPLYSRPLPAAPGSAAAWLARLVCALPGHWTPLYASQDHGLGANRFLHHTLAYRGPTLVVVAARGTDLAVVIGSATEWRETHQYWGSADSFLMQLEPTYALVEKAPKMLYLNTSIRGYPHGLRAGSDPRKPILSVNADFDHFEYKGAPYAIADIEVWGCGDVSSRETQLEIKKWQVREAERQRQVKLSAADWIEHPDRYLLELAGRPQYNNSAS